MRRIARRSGSARKKRLGGVRNTIIQIRKEHRGELAIRDTKKIPDDHATRKVCADLYPAAVHICGDDPQIDLIKGQAQVNLAKGQDHRYQDQ